MTTKRIEKAKKRADRADAACRNAYLALSDAQGAHLRKMGWERVWNWPDRYKLWRKGQKVCTTTAALREQVKLDRRRAKDKARKAEATRKKPIPSP